MRHRLLFTQLRRPSRRTRVLVAVLVATQYPWSALAARTNEPSAASAVASPSPPLSAAATVLPSSPTPAATVTPPPARLTFSGLPTDAEIFRARLFSEPLVPIGRATRPIENIRLAQALRTYATARRPEDVAPITRFLDEYRDSPWRASLLVNLGEVYERTGYARRALDAWNEAWTLTKDATDVHGRAVADRALAEWLTLTFGRGDIEATRRRLRETASREVGGSAETKFRNVREQLSILAHQPHLLVPAEQQALARLAAYERKLARHSVAMNDRADHRAPQRTVGRSADLPRLTRGSGQPPPARRSWASTLRRALRLGLSVRAGVRTARGRLLPRSLVHLRTGHAVAVLDAQTDRLLVYDPLRGDDRWIAAAALEEDASGAALIAAGPLPDGWEATSASTAVFVMQMCPPGPPNDNDPPPCDCAGGAAGGPGGGGGGGGAGGGGSPEPGGGGEPSSECGSGPCATADNALARYRLHRLTAGLLVEDTPVGHKPPRGPAVFFHVRYNHRAGFLPQVPFFSNLGPKWTHDWLSYVEDLPVSCGAGGAGGNCTPPHARVVLRGGGTERHIPSGPTTYHRHWRSASEFVRISNAPLRFERRLRDGSVEVYAQWDGVPAGQGARVFLTQIIDPRGQSVQLTYDSQFRLVSITDALGQVTTLAYELATDPLKITKVTDPFGRFATFTYTATGQLASITDVIGLTSSFLYSGDFLTRLTTPYGTTTFRKETDWQNDAFVRHIEAIDPLGGVERVEYRTELPTLPDSVPSSEVPTGFEDFNGALDQFVSLYWDKRAMALAPRDPASAVITSWLTENLFNRLWVGVGVPRYVKRPLEGRIWYAYPGQDPGGGEVGSWIRPATVARVLDDGTSQIWQSTYNDHGMVTSRTDPLGRRTSYTYAANGIDLLEMRQTTGALNDLLFMLSNYNAQHLPQTVVDPAGQTTTFTYNPNGQAATTTNANNETTTYTYDPNGKGYLTAIVEAPPGGTTTYTYDGYGRVRTTTEPDGYTVTADYDALNRVTKLTYPDGSYDQRTYEKLDVVEYRDRLGRVTRRSYDALRRLVVTRDPLGRTIGQQWCGCGSLEALIDSGGRRTRWEYDVQGRLLQEIRPDGVVAAAYTYELTTSRLKTRTDAKQQVASRTYHADDTVASITYQNAQIATTSTTFTHDPNYPRLTTVQHGIGITAYTYHPAGVLGAGRLATVSGPFAGDTIAYGYDAIDRMTSRTVNGVQTVVTYDGAGRIATETSPDGVFTYAYDGATGRLSTVTYPNGQTSLYSYFGGMADRRLMSIHHKAPGGATISRFEYTYDAGAGIETSTHQKDADPARVWSYSHDAAGQLLSAIRRGPSQTVEQQYAYRYDAAGNRIGISHDDRVIEDVFDHVNRLTLRKTGNVLPVAGTVSEPAVVTVQGAPAPGTSATDFRAAVPVQPGQNLVTVTATDGSGNLASQTYAVDLTTESTRSFVYDANGNLVSDGTRQFEWDAADRLVAVTTGQRRTAFTYDGVDNRTRVTVTENSTVIADTVYLWCRGTLCGRRDGSTTTQVGDLHESDGTSVVYLTRDKLGSVRERVSAAGAVVGRRDYLPWGEPIVTGTDTTDRQFTGLIGVAPEGLLLARYRVYDSQLGRWLSADPAGFKGGTNLYAYVGNDPLRWIDPEGLFGIGPPNPNRNTIICDGRGQITVQIGNPGTPIQERCFKDCIVIHELRHKDHADRAAPGICRDQKRGMTVGFTGMGQEQRNSEYWAHVAHLGCLRMLAIDACECKDTINDAITWTESERDRYK